MNEHMQKDVFYQTFTQLLGVMEDLLPAAPPLKQPKRGITEPFSLFLGYGALRPSFGSPVVIVLLDKNFHLAAWHANSCMKHMHN